LVEWGKGIVFYFFKEDKFMSNRVTPTTTTAPQTTSIPHEKIAMRAYDKWCKRGRPQGTEKLDWMEAEAELRAETSRPQAQQRR
jgi:hypothetical protein